MNDIDKVEAAVNEIQRTYNLDQKYADLLKKNIINRVNLYKDVNVKSNEQSVINNSNSITDLLLNRLINNIRDYRFDTTYDLNNTDKGTYMSKLQQVYIANEKFLQDITASRLKNKIPNPSPEMVDKAVEKVFNHEIGHALQMNFNGNNGVNNSKYQLLVSSLASKYPNDFANVTEFKDFDLQQHGMKPVRRNDEKQKVRNYYAPMYYTTHLDEIFNDEEALQVTGINESQFNYNMGDGYYKKVYNYESSNYKITSYATMMKILMGKERTFNSMYVDSIETYEYFDRFLKLSNDVFKDSKFVGKPPMLNILNGLNEIKSNGPEALTEANKLDLFFSSCLCIKINQQLKKDSLTLEKIAEYEKYINTFKDLMVHNNKKVLRQEQNLNDMLKRLNEKKQSLSNNTTANLETNSQYHHPMAARLNELERIKQAAKQNNDAVAYQNAQREIENIVNQNKANISSEQWDTMSNEDKISFIKVKIRESQVLHNRDDFNYWNANLQELLNKQNKTSQTQNQPLPTNNVTPSVEANNLEQEQSLSHNNASAFPEEKIETLEEKIETLEEELDSSINKYKEDLSKGYKYFYDKMMEIVKTYDPNVNYSDVEKKDLIGRIFYYEGYMTAALTNDQQIIELITLVVDELKNNKLEDELLQNILSDIQYEYNKLHPNENIKDEEQDKNKINKEQEKREENKEQEKRKNNEEQEEEINNKKKVAKLTQELRNKLSKIQSQYHDMLSDRNIDEDELYSLKRMVAQVIDDGYTLKSIATDENDKKKVIVIINELEKEHQKMTKMLNSMPELARRHL